MIRRQSGFTLVEIAVVLVIIGLLLGGVLKGQELIASARVRNMADQQSGIQAAYYGFNDRYRAVPGDMDSAAAADAIGGTINLGGDGNGRLLGPTDSTPWAELNGVWEHLSKAGFIKGSYDGNNGSSAPTADDGPVNVFNGNLIMARHTGYAGTSPERLLLHMGRQTPVDIARELDVKLDDGRPETGIVRSVPAGTNAWQSDDTTACTVGTAPDIIWNIDANSQDCNPTYLF